MSVCLYCCLSYPACKSHLFCAVLYCHLWPVWLCNIFPHYFINGTIFREKKCIKHKRSVLIFLYKLCRKRFSFYRDFSEILMYICKPSCKVPVTLVRF
jgi:hypothetical protein